MAQTWATHCYQHKIKVCSLSEW